MMPTFLSPAELHGRLVAAGHSLKDDSGGLSTTVKQTPETIISIASNLDPTLMPAYRGRYFACPLKSEEDRTPVLRDEPAFALPGRFRRLDEGRAYASIFLDGPFRWLLPRLIGFREILAWPDDYAGDFAREVLSNASTGLRRLLPVDLVTSGAVVLDLKRDEDCRALWDVAASVADGFDNVFVSDSACAEVALLHHHDEIRLSIPDEVRRRSILDALSSCESLEDCSGYTSSWDEEGGS